VVWTQIIFVDLEVSYLAGTANKNFVSKRQAFKKGYWGKAYKAHVPAVSI